MKTSPSLVKTRSLPQGCGTSREGDKAPRYPKLPTCNLLYFCVFAPLREITWRRLCTALFLAAVLPASAAPSAVADEPRHEAFFSYNATTWQESDAAGGQLLKEDGYTVGLHLRSVWREGRRPDVRTEVSGVIGSLDYDGMTFGGSPLRSTTEYRGLGAAVDAGVTTDVGATADVRWFAGLSTEGWIRSIDDTGQISDESYKEFWYTLDALAGLTLRWEHSTRFSWFLEPGITYPVYQRVAYDLTFPDGTDDVSVEPGREPGFRVEAGLRTARVLVSLLYARREFGRSDAVAVQPFSVLQPASEREVLAVRFGIRF